MAYNKRSYKHKSELQPLTNDNETNRQHGSRSTHQPLTETQDIKVSRKVIKFRGCK